MADREYNLEADPLRGETSAECVDIQDEGTVGVKGQGDTHGNIDVKAEDHHGKIPTDTEWAWMCVVAVFLVFFLAVGTAHKCFGVFFVEFIREFGGTTRATSWISSLSQFLALAMGPLAGFLGSRITIRVTIATGGLLIATGFISSIFAPSLPFLYFSYGALVGLGTALVYTPSVTTMNQYFSRRRGLANGIGAAGDGAANFLVPPLVTSLLHRYSLRGTLLIVGGLMLNLTVCALLLRPTSFYTQRVRQGSRGQRSRTGSRGQGSEKGHKDRVVRYTSPDRLETASLTDSMDAGDQEAPPPTINGTTNTTTINNGDLDRLDLVRNNLGNEDSNKSGLVADGNDTSKHAQNAPGSRFEWGVIRNPVVIVMFVCVLVLHSGGPTAVIFLPSLGISAGLTDHHASLLLSSLGVGDLIGKTILGWLADFNFTNKRNFFILSVCIMGVSTAAMPFVGGNFYTLAVLSFLFGVGNGNAFGLLPVLLAEGVGPALLPSAYPVITVGLGIPLLYAIPLGGYLVDRTGNYTATYVLSGILIIVSSLVPLILYAVDKRTKYKRPEVCTTSIDRK